MTKLNDMPIKRHSSDVAYLHNQEICLLAHRLLVNLQMFKKNLNYLLYLSNKKTYCIINFGYSCS